MNSTVCIPQSEYNELLQKASLLDSIIDSESLTTEELERLKKARMDPSITEEEFLNRHPELKSPIGKKLVGNPYWSIHIGKFRVIYVFHKHSQEIEIVDILNRKHGYREI